MNINNFSRTERAGGAIGSTFKFLFGWIKHIDATNIAIYLGLFGWIFALYMDWASALQILGTSTVIVFFAGLFMIEDHEYYGGWFIWWMVVIGYSMFYFKGNIEVTIVNQSDKVYMKEAVLNGSQIEYMGGDEMTKVITLSDKSIIAHYGKFKDSDRFKPFIHKSKTTNILLDYVGIDYIVAQNQWITLNDTVANKTLFKIK